MAKNDNLTDFLTDIADTIREKYGLSDSEKINPQDFTNYISTPINQTYSVKITNNENWEAENIYIYYHTILNGSIAFFFEKIDHGDSSTISVIPNSTIIISSSGSLSIQDDTDDSVVNSFVTLGNYQLYKIKIIQNNYQIHTFD